MDFYGFRTKVGFENCRKQWFQNTRRLWKQKNFSSEISRHKEVSRLERSHLIIFLHEGICGTENPKCSTFQYDILKNMLIRMWHALGFHESCFKAEKVGKRALVSFRSEIKGKLHKLSRWKTFSLSLIVAIVSSGSFFFVVKISSDKENFVCVQKYFRWRKEEKNYTKVVDLRIVEFSKNMKFFRADFLSLVRSLAHVCILLP